MALLVARLGARTDLLESNHRSDAPYDSKYIYSWCRHSEEYSEDFLVDQMVVESSRLLTLCCALTSITSKKGMAYGMKTRRGSKGAWNLMLLFTQGFDVTSLKIYYIILISFTFPEKHSSSPSQSTPLVGPSSHSTFPKQVPDISLAPAIFPRT